MVFAEHNSLKLDVFFNSIIYSMFFMIHAFQGPGFSGPGSRVRAQVLEVAYHIQSSIKNPIKYIRWHFFPK